MSQFRKFRGNVRNVFVPNESFILVSFVIFRPFVIIVYLYSTSIPINLSGVTSKIFSIKNILRKNWRKKNARKNRAERDNTKTKICV